MTSKQLAGTVLLTAIFIVLPAFIILPAQANIHTDNHTPNAAQLHTLAKQGDISAQYELGLMYAEGIGAEKNLSKAKHYLDKVINNTNKSTLILADVAKIYWEIFELWKY
jgi:TPR repeat protein